MFFDGVGGDDDVYVGEKILRVKFFFEDFDGGVI